MTHQRPLPASNLIAGYEDLRTSNYTRSETCGYALLVHRGLAAWIDAWSAYVPAREESNQSADSSAAEQRETLSRTPLPIVMQTEMVTVLASMALGQEVRL